MTLIEFIGFIITFVAMIALFFRRRIEMSRQLRDPQFYEQVQQRKEESLKEFLRAFDVEHEELSDDKEDEEDEEEEEEEEEETSPPVRVMERKLGPQPHAQEWQRSVGNKYKFLSTMEQYKSHSPIERRQQESKVEKKCERSFWEKEIICRDVWSRKMEGSYSIEEGISRGSETLARLDTLKDMVIFHEVFGPPKAFRD